MLKYRATHGSGIWLLMCPKANKGASLGRGYLNVVADADKGATSGCAYLNVAVDVPQSR